MTTTFTGQGSFDAIVVGSGAAGLAATKGLVERGLRVLVLEAGPLSAHDGRVDRRIATNPNHSIQRRTSAYDTSSADYWIDDSLFPYDSSGSDQFHWYRSRGLGGRLRLWAGVSLRMSDQEFAGEDGHERWPISYADLSGHYRWAETVMRVSNTETLMPHSDGSASPKGCLSGRFESLTTADPIFNRVAQQRVEGEWARTIASGRVLLLPESEVFEVVVGSQGDKVMGIRFRAPDGKACFASAERYFLGASTIETVRLLLSCQSVKHKSGLGGNSGLLGRFFIDHVTGPFVRGYLPATLDPMVMPESNYCPVVSFADTSKERGDRQGGYGFGLTLSMPKDEPRNASSRQWYETARKLGRSGFQFWGQGESHPNFANRVSLGKGVDASGRPVAEITYSFSDDDVRQGGRQLVEMRRLANGVGLYVTEARGGLAPPGTSMHELGGARMGARREDSVVDKSCRLWGVTNLYIVDGSVFPRGGWQNPTLTIMALAHRAAAEAT